MKTHIQQPYPLRGRRTGASRGRNQQQGAVLVVGLIILVVLTMLGIQGMRTNVAQERMAANMRERNVAFQAAEAALRVGESPELVVGEEDDLADPSNWAGDGPTGTLTDFDAGLAADPVFHVGPPQYVRVGVSIPPEFRLIYPIASRGVGGQPSSVVVLQSGFEPPN